MHPTVISSHCANNAIIEFLRHVAIAARVEGND